MNATTMPTTEPLAHPAAPLARPAPKPVILILADISGYTRYMTANATSLAHSQIIITELFNAILSEVELPLCASVRLCRNSRTAEAASVLRRGP